MLASAENAFVTHNLIRVMPAEGNIYSFLEFFSSVSRAGGIFCASQFAPPWARYFYIEPPEHALRALEIQNY